MMAPLVVLSVLLFTALFRLWSDLSRIARREHPVGRLPAQGGPAALPAVRDLQTRRLEWRLQLDRRVRFIRIMSGAAPLLGLLGTVSGMLKTFQGLGLRSSVNTMDLVAIGISEALITTEMGLTVGILSLVFIYFVQERRRRLHARAEIREFQLLLTAEPPRPC